MPIEEEAPPTGAPASTKPKQDLASISQAVASRQLRAPEARNGEQLHFGLPANDRGDGTSTGRE